MPKSYSQYKYEDLLSLNLSVVSIEILFPNISEVPESDFLKIILERNLKQRHTTEKSKSEFIIAPILYEIALNNADKISFFSGHNLDVDKEKGLKGFCDFLFTRVPKSPMIQEPIFCVVEAKNEVLETGIPQCIAEMYAARLFNERKGKPTPIVYGCVTTGRLWGFLILENDTVQQDTVIYALSELPQILGILQHIVSQ